jgi:O-antigen ligase
MLVTAGRTNASTPPFSSQVLQQHRRRFLLFTLLIALAVTSVFLIVLKQQVISLDVLAAAILLLPLFLRWLWRRPVRGVYILAAAATALEVVFPPNPFPDDIGPYTPFFEDIQSWTHIRGPAFSIAELFMLLVLVIWLLKGIAQRNFRFEKGSLMRPVGLYMLMVLVGELHGVSSGGDITLSLWEVRSQVYMFVAYILTCNLLRTRQDVNIIITVLMVGTGLKGLQGVFRYFFELHRNLHNIESIFPHEQSFFFNLFIIMTVILFLFGGSGRLKRVALILLPFVLIAALANQRRAAVLALVVGALCLLVGTAVAHPKKRKPIAIIMLVLAVVLPVYYQMYKNSGGLIGEPARAISSAFNPSQRDAGSDQYRVTEDKDLMATMKLSPIIGYGYGKNFLTPYPLTDISNLYNFYLLEPHDSVLWVWMRLGTIGFLLFWFLIGSAIVQSARLARLLRDPYLKGVALFCLTTVIQEVIFGYLDLQWSNYRNLIFMGVVFAMIGRLSSLDSNTAGTPGRLAIQHRSSGRVLR